MNEYVKKIEVAFNNLKDFPITFNTKAESENYYHQQYTNFYKTAHDFYFPRLKKTHLHVNQRLFRIIKKYKEEQITKVTDIANPPACKTELGRCNLPWFPALYVSSNPAAAVIETIKENDIPDNGQTYYLSEWECLSEINLNTVIFLTGSLTNKHPWSELANEYEMQCIKKFKNFAKEEDIVSLLTHVSQKFLSEDSHTTSSFLSHQLLQEYEYGADYVIYPSVREKTCSVNFAFSPRLINLNYIKLKVAYELNIKSLKYSNNNSLINMPHNILNSFISSNNEDLEIKTFDINQEGIPEIFKRYFI